MGKLFDITVNYRVKEDIFSSATGSLELENAVSKMAATL